jgi:hypothetical protein
MDSKDKEEVQSGELLEGASAPLNVDKGEVSPSPKRQIIAKKYIFIAIGITVAVALLGLIAIKATGSSKKSAPKPADTSSQPNQTQALDQKTLNKLTTTTSPATSPEGQLTISSNTLFKSAVEVQGNVKIDKDLAVGGNVIVKGTTVMQGPVGIDNSLSVRGALSVGGPLNAPTLSVGSLSVTNMNISGNFNFGGHISPGGATPNARASVSAGGGTVSINGNDTSGTIIINTSSASGPGEMATVTFRTPFSSTPHVQLTPTNGASAALNYFTTRSAGTFSVETGSGTSGGTTYVFDYLVTQ